MKVSTFLSVVMLGLMVTYFMVREPEMPRALTQAQVAKANMLRATEDGDLVMYETGKVRLVKSNNSTPEGGTVSTIYSTINLRNPDQLDAISGTVSKKDLRMYAMIIMACYLN